jgi:hypothetical protein
MFDWLKQKQSAKQPARRPRAVLPTDVTDSDVVLCKSSLKIRNAYEIRLALFFAVNSGKRFVLNVPTGAEVEPGLRSHIAHHGGIVQEGESSDYSVYVGHALPSGGEGDGWVLGDAAVLASLIGSLKSPWLKRKLLPGTALAGTELHEFAAEMQGEVITISNIDGENIKVALAALFKSAMTHGGNIFVQ